MLFRSKNKLHELRNDGDRKLGGMIQGLGFVAKKSVKKSWPKDKRVGRKVLCTTCFFCFSLCCSFTKIGKVGQ